MLLRDCKQKNNGSYKTGTKKGTGKCGDAEKTAVQRRETRWNTIYTTAVCYPEDLNLKAEGVSEAGGQRAALDTCRNRQRCLCCITLLRIQRLWISPAAVQTGLTTTVKDGELSGSSWVSDRLQIEAISVSSFLWALGGFAFFIHEGGIYSPRKLLDSRGKGKRFVCLPRQRQESGGGTSRQTSDSRKDRA